jgi:mycofactocin precursor
MDDQALVQPSAPDTAADPLADGELLVEDVSIDGMCGVY